MEAALADFDAQFTSSVFWTRSDEPRNTSTDGSNPFEPSVFQQDNVQWQAEIAKKTANGTQIFFRNVNTYTENNIPLVSDPAPNNGFQVLDDWYRASYEMEVRQPLLRGRGAFIQRMPVVISRIGTDQELANLEAQLQNMVTNIEIRYWELYCAYRNLEASKTGRDAALETWRIVQDQFDEGADVNIQQVAQAREQYHFFDAQVIDSYNSLLSAESNLRWLLGLATTDGRVIRPIDEAVMAPIEFDWCNSLCEALSYRPELRQERWEIKKRELALAYSKNGLLPELNVTALYRWLGLGNKFGASDSGALPYPDVSSGALNDLYDGNYQEFQLGGEYRMPIGFRRELSNVRNAQLKLAREIARLEDMELDVSRELAEVIRALAANYRIMHSSFNRWKETTIEEDHFIELQDAGVETLDVALDAQRRRAQAEQAFYNALCEYNKSIALIHRRKGTILAYDGICFAEGPWPGKAYSDAQEHARRRGASRQINYGWTRPQVVSRGTDWPTNHNSGATGGSPVNTSIPTEIPMDGGMAPVDSPYMQGEIMDGQIIDNGMMQGEVIQPYYDDATGLQAPTNNEPTPTGASLEGSSSRIYRDANIQQASYAAPTKSSRNTRLPKRDDATAPVSRATKEATPNAQSSRARRAKPQSQTQNRGSSRSNVKPSTKTPTKTLIAAPRQSANSNRTRGNGINWEKFGLTRPTENSGRTEAQIKTNN